MHRKFHIPCHAVDPGVELWRRAVPFRLAWVMTALALTLAGTAAAAGGQPPESTEAILRGALNVKDLRGGRIFLVRELDDTTRELAMRGVALLAQLQQAGLPLNETPSAPVVEKVLSQRLTDLAAGVPEPKERIFELEDVGRTRIAPHPKLVSRYRERFDALNPFNLRGQLAEIETLLGADLRTLHSIQLRGYRGITGDIDFLGIQVRGRAADSAGAEQVAQAAAGALWLDEVAAYLIQTRGGLLGPIPRDEIASGGAVAEWQEFYRIAFPDLDHAVRLRTLDSAGLDADGRFEVRDLPGEVVVTMNLFGETVYFVEGDPKSPLKIARYGKEHNES